MTAPPQDAPTIERAMVLAAGLGKRMRPLTDRIPKPLVDVAGRSLLDRALDHVQAAGVETAVVNTFYKGEMIARHLEGRAAPRIRLSPEEELLETGGGVAKALPMLGSEPFYVINSDALWLDGEGSGLRRLAAAWDDSRMDALLLLYPVAGAVGFAGRGDFFIDPAGRLERRGERDSAPLLFTGIQVLHPRLFVDTPAGKYSLNLLYDRALATDRLYGLCHDGSWYHVGTPEGHREVEAILAGMSLSA